ncbi:MAG: dockerin type I repeat-containing protein, partial [Oscillospiraceae bacterium]|nr:dockerin type I repeat-containing protein [Oscillospiraceae bacterium]
TSTATSPTTTSTTTSTRTSTTTSTTTTSTTTSTTTASTTTSATTTSTTTTTELIPAILYGDIDNNSMLSVQDLSLLRKYLIGKISFTEDDFLRADVSQDGIVNIYDFVITKKMLLES